ncbi:hypothetical protein VCR29J2_1000010 [Vibrio coralliirubri]|nr:hypothetical protein VCR29J2_1000010 [Vibrio coralliirubri]
MDGNKDGIVDNKEPNEQGVACTIDAPDREVIVNMINVRGGWPSQIFITC